MQVRRSARRQAALLQLCAALAWPASRRLLLPTIPWMKKQSCVCRKAASQVRATEVEDHLTCMWASSGGLQQPDAEQQLAQIQTEAHPLCEMSLGCTSEFLLQAKS